MLISHETPISMLDVSRYYNDYDYCLVHLLPEFSEYRDFYFASVQQGRRVLLDNSIFELGEAYDSEKFAEWIAHLRPTEYIIPDKLEDTQGTILSFSAFKENYSNLPGMCIGVVQGKDFKELKECYLFLSSKVNKLAISFDYSYYLNLENDNDYKALYKKIQETLNIEDVHLQSKWCRYAIGRVTTLYKLYAGGVFDVSKKHHLLGCSVPWEFKMLNLLPNNLIKSIETIDTSNPIVAGLLSKRYKDSYGLLEKWSCKLVDYINSEVTPKQIIDIQHNINVFRSFCK
jgi:hypothetical protein